MFSALLYDYLKSRNDGKKEKKTVTPYRIRIFLTYLIPPSFIKASVSQKPLPWRPLNSHGNMLKQLNVLNRLNFFPKESENQDKQNIQRLSDFGVKVKMLLILELSWTFIIILDKFNGKQLRVPTRKLQWTTRGTIQTSQEGTEVRLWGTKWNLEPFITHQIYSLHGIP